MAKKLKVGQSINKPESGDETRTREKENRTFLIFVIGIPLVLIIVITLISRFKLLG
ncbi:MAG: hypothetical protein IT462_05730 [Planctomycetes bacterium]|nr:hypothetical protein [Planctomycetota bacterium]